MAFLKRCCMITRNLYFLHEPTLHNTLKFNVPRTCHGLRFNSNDNSMSSIESNQASEVEPKSDDEHKLNYIRLELSIQQQQGKRVPDPDLISKNHWDELLNKETKSARKKFYAYLLDMQEKKEKKKVREIIENHKS